jgi:hypothetical protein
MIDLRFLQTMYQQWMQGHEAYVHCWRDFVELAVKQTGQQQDEIMSQLQKTRWFCWCPEEK